MALCAKHYMDYDRALNARAPRKTTFTSIGSRNTDHAVRMALETRRANAAEHAARVRESCDRVRNDCANGRGCS